MRGTPFILGPAEIAALHQLRELAWVNPVNIRRVARQIATPEGKARHRAQMTAQSLMLPFGFMVTFSIERGHPAAATCLHLTMSSPVVGRVPRPEAVQMVAGELGFTGAIEDWASWIEELEGHGKAVNVVQPVAERDHV